MILIPFSSHTFLNFQVLCVKLGSSFGLWIGEQQYLSSDRLFRIRRGEIKNTKFLHWQVGPFIFTLAFLFSQSSFIRALLVSRFIYNYQSYIPQPLIFIGFLFCLIILTTIGTHCSFIIPVWLIRYYESYYQFYPRRKYTSTCRGLSQIFPQWKLSSQFCSFYFHLKCFQSFCSMIRIWKVSTFVIKPINRQKVRKKIFSSLVLPKSFIPTYLYFYQFWRVRSVVLQYCSKK